MPDFPAGRPGASCGTLSTQNPLQCPAAWAALCAITGSGAALATATAWGTADRAMYVPVRLEGSGTVYQLSVQNGGTANGTTDVALYNEDFVRLVASGPTNQAGTSQIQLFDVTDTQIGSGIYFLGLVNSGTTGTYLGAVSTVGRNRMSGIVEQASVASSTLPDPAVPVSSTNLFFPVISAHFRSTV